MKAQALYDRRERLGEIDSQDLHRIFQAVLNDPSPAGRKEIDREALRAYAADMRAVYAAHRQSGTIGAEYLLDVAKFCEAFVN